MSIYQNAGSKIASMPKAIFRLFRSGNKNQRIIADYEKALRKELKAEAKKSDRRLSALAADFPNLGLCKNNGNAKIIREYSASTSGSSSNLDYLAAISDTSSETDIPSKQDGFMRFSIHADTMPRASYTLEMPVEMPEKQDGFMVDASLVNAGRRESIIVRTVAEQKDSPISDAWSTERKVCWSDSGDDVVEYVKTREPKSFRERIQAARV